MTSLALSSRRRQWRASELCIWLGALYTIYNMVPKEFKDAKWLIIDDMDVGKPLKRRVKLKKGDD